MHVLTVVCSFAACDVPGIHRLLPQAWREWEFFDNIYKLVGVPVVTVQMRFNGWVTEMQELELSRYRSIQLFVVLFCLVSILQF